MDYFKENDKKQINDKLIIIIAEDSLRKRY